MLLPALDLVAELPEGLQDVDEEERGPADDEDDDDGREHTDNLKGMSKIKETPGREHQSMQL